MEQQIKELQEIMMSLGKSPEVANEQLLLLFAQRHGWVSLISVPDGERVFSEDGTSSEQKVKTIDNPVTALEFSKQIIVGFINTSIREQAKVEASRQADTYIDSLIK